jgi:two-component system chemotaxis sensor kinase CheA
MSTTSGAEENFLTPAEVAEIRQAFFDQGRAALDSLSHDLLALEGKVPTDALLRPLRRAAHTLKGDCATVGFPELSRLSHALEDAMAAMQLWNRPVTAAEDDVLLLAVDVLRTGLEAAARGGAEPDVEVATLRLSRMILAATPEAAWERLSEAQLRRVRDAGATGLRPLRATLVLSPTRRRTRRAPDTVFARLGLQVVAVAPATHLAGGAERIEAIVLTAAEPEAVQARAARLRGVKIELVPWLEPRPSDGLPGEGPEPDVEVASVYGHTEGSREGETIRLEARRVDDVLTLVGEMVTARSSIAAVAAEIEGFLSEDLAARLAEAQSLLGRVLQDLQRSAMRMRMVPAERVFRRFYRAVRDLGRKRGKSLTLVIEGETTELDRGILDALEEPLLHLVRNAVDHGLESPEERRAAGKREIGRITLRASREGNQILVEVTDDGRGIDAAAVSRRAVEMGLISEAKAQTLSDEEACQIIFSPGFSTARQVTETSGRGVGLDIVQEKVNALRGALRAANRPEGGASFVIKVPLTVAIIQALLFRVGGRELAVPLTAVVEIARSSDVGMQRVGEREVFRVREEVLDLIRTGPLMGLPQLAGPPPYIIVLESSAGRFGVAADALIGEQELVIKAVHDRYIRTPLVAGAAVVGGGVVVLILDVPALYRAALPLEGVSHV